MQAVGVILYWSFFHFETRQMDILNKVTNGLNKKSSDSIYPFLGTPIQINTPDGDQIILNPYVEPKEQVNMQEVDESQPYVYIPIL